MNSTAAKAFRVWELLMRTDEEHPLSAPQIVSRLRAEYGIETERKSIYRLVQQTLISEMGMDIELISGAKGGYYLCSRKYEDWQIKLLVDAVASARFLCEDDAKKLIKKLLGELSTAGANALARMAASPVHRSEDGRTRYAIDAVLQAIKQGKMLTFRYRKLDRQFKPVSRRNGKLYSFSPYRLYWQDDRYYVIGNTDGYNDLSTYRPDRMVSVTVAETLVRDMSEILGNNPQAALSEYLSRSVYRYGGEAIRLKIKCAPGTEGDVYDRFGRPEGIKYTDDGFECTVQTQDSEGLIYWLLQNARSITALSPKTVRGKLAETLRQALSQYSD